LPKGWSATKLVAQTAKPAAPAKNQPTAASQQLENATVAAQSALLSRKALGESAAHFTVLLDPAHGGKDAGAMLSSPSGNAYAAPLLEKDAMLNLAERLRAALSDREVPVRLTRSDDTTLGDGERATQGSALDGGVCITLHATATGAGVHVFYPMTQFGLPNHSFLDQWASAGVAPSTQSQPLAKALQAALAKSQIPATVEPATGPVISRERCAAVAVELAPLRAEGAAAVTAADAQYQQHVAAAVAQAIADWRDQRRALDEKAAAYARKSRR
jgi:N-acetylmuramoyl-L-alanine amidase